MDLLTRRATPRRIVVVALTFALVVSGMAGSDATAKRRRAHRLQAEQTECPAGPAQNHEPCHEDFEGPPGDPTCFDGIDNDLDGTIDGDNDGVIETVNGVQEDADCETIPGDPCSDGLDNEATDPQGGDGKIDLEDSDCQSKEGPPGDPTCSDGIDNDGDGLVDLRDPDCLAGGGAPAAPEEPLPPQPEEPNPCANPTIVGTPLNDKLKGTSGRDIIDGLGGNDKIRAKRGNDIICGGPGNDRLRGGRGNDLVFGEEGNEKARGGPGVDEVDGGPDFDKCRNGRGNDPPVRNCEKILGPGGSLK